MPMWDYVLNRESILTQRLKDTALYNTLFSGSQRHNVESKSVSTLVCKKTPSKKHKNNNGVHMSCLVLIMLYTYSVKGHHDYWSVFEI